MSNHGIGNLKNGRSEILRKNVFGGVNDFGVKDFAQKMFRGAIWGVNDFAKKMGVKDFAKKIGGQIFCAKMLGGK
jgi:hypothetical protein